MRAYTSHAVVGGFVASDTDHYTTETLASDLRFRVPGRGEGYHGDALYIVLKL